MSRALALTSQNGYRPQFRNTILEAIAVPKVNRIGTMSWQRFPGEDRPTYDGDEIFNKLSYKSLFIFCHKLTTCLAIPLGISLKYTIQEKYLGWTFQNFNSSCLLMVKLQVSFFIFFFTVLINSFSTYLLKAQFYGRLGTCISEVNKIRYHCGNFCWC